MKKRNLWYFICTFFFSLAIAPGAPAAEKYPAREIQLVLGTPPGGAMAIAIQLVKDNLEKNLGVPLVLNFKTGGGGATGPTFLAKTKADGYTIGCISSADMLLLPATMPNVPFRYTDLDPLSKYFSNPNGVFCKGDAPWKTLEALVSDARKRPGQITYGATTNSLSHLLMEGFLKTAGITMLHVPTEAAGQTITRVLGGNLDVGIVALAPLVGQLKAQTLRALFLTTPERVSTFPTIPTLKENGYPPPILSLYMGFYAPLGMPKTVHEVLEKAFEKTFKDPALKKRLEEEALILDYAPADVFAKQLKEDSERIIKFLKTAGPHK